MNIPLATPTAPAPPPALDAVGLSSAVMQDILLKTMHRTDAATAGDIAGRIALPPAVTQELIDTARQRELVEATGRPHPNSGDEAGFRLSESGRARAIEALRQSPYHGAMPVPLADHARQVRQQSIRNLAMTRDRLNVAMGDLILPPSLIDRLGPAVGSGRSILLYGPPGNGKSSISTAICAAIGGAVHVPRALEYAGQVITLYDPIVHTALDEEAEVPGTLRLHRHHDARYVLCRRPIVVAGRDLTLDMLSLVHDPTAGTYRAPLQLKAAGGVLVLDDLGREDAPPRALIDRWIVPLEQSKDILALRSGETFEVPFDTLMIFCTGVHPDRIFGQAALRRIFCKIRVDGPDQTDFLRIFSMVAKRTGLPPDEGALLHLMQGKYPQIGNAYAGYHPAFLVDQILSICAFEGIEPQMSPVLVDRAWANLFVDEGEGAG